MINSVQSTINTRGGRVRFTALWPLAAAVAVGGWSMRPVGISPALLTLLPVSTPAIVWNACAMVADTRTRREEARAHTLMGTPVTIDSSSQVTLRASFVSLVLSPIAVLGIAYGDSEFSSLVTRLATVQAGILTGVDATNGNGNLAPTPLPTVARPVALTLGQTYVVRVTVRATELLDALGEMVLRRHAQIAILTNVGRFVVDFASEIGRLWQWDPLLRNAWSTDGDRIFDARGNPSASRLPVAVTRLAAWVDYYLGRGTGTETPPAFEGLVSYAAKFSRLRNAATLDTALNLDVAARLAMTAVNPRDRGAGASVDCLIGNDRIVRSLMASPWGLTGSSGWRMDVRTGLNVYHYAGIPVYRCNLSNYIEIIADVPVEDPDKSYLFAANLGRDGLCLVHANGNADTLGIQVDEEPVSPQQGQVRYVVHGAWAPFAFDPGAIIGYGKVNYTSA